MRSQWQKNKARQRQQATTRSANTPKAWSMRMPTALARRAIRSRLFIARLASAVGIRIDQALGVLADRVVACCLCRALFFCHCDRIANLDCRHLILPDSPQ